jgi:alkylation response protein AidB-like acyl-CoA dehydrogenase
MISVREVEAVLETCLVRRDQHTRVTTLGAGGYDVEAGRRYLAATVEAGLAVPSWPAEHGGRNADADDVAIIKRAHATFAVPDLYPFRVGLHMVGPTLFEHGTDEQRRRWLRDIATGTAIWSQLFSEPDAGSDLANVSALARRDGDDWVLDGQKVWTSRGAYADWGICLARHDTEAPKHAGLTMFAVPMDTPGIQVRPLRQINGDTHFSEVFLDGARARDVDRIARVGDGWRVATSLLAHERAAADRTAPRAIGDSALPVWLAELADSGRLGGEAVARDRAMTLLAYEESIRFTQLRSAATGAAGSGLKLHGAVSFKRRAELMLDVLGPAGTLAGSDAAVEFLTAPSMSIRGGTDEIQRNVLGERVLGLPPEPRVDRDVPWSTSRRGTTA